MKIITTILLIAFCFVVISSFTQPLKKDSLSPKIIWVTKKQMDSIFNSQPKRVYNADSLIKANTSTGVYSKKSNNLIQIDSCERKFIKSIFNDVYNNKEEWVVVKVGDLYKTWNEIISSKIFYDIYLNNFRKSYRDTAIKNYNGYMLSTELKYFSHTGFDVDNPIFKDYYKGYKKDTSQYNKLSKQGLQTVLKKYFDKKQQLLDKYKPIQMQIFWYLFDNRVRVVTPQKGKSYYILYDCATTFFPKASYAAYF